MIQGPRYSRKRSVEWEGYKVHLTETCDEDTPDVIVNVVTTPATTPDDHMVEVIHASLAPRELLPAEHLVDKGYADADVLVASQQKYDVAIVGPVAGDPSWQARTDEGFDKSQFLVDWDRQVVTCPAGKQSLSWLPNTYPKNGMVWEVRFARKDCTPCAHRAHGTKARQEPRILGCRHVSIMRPCKPRGNGRRPRHFSSNMRPERGSKVRMSKPSAGVAYGDVTTSARPKPICSTSSPPPRSTSYG